MLYSLSSSKTETQTQLGISDQILQSVCKSSDVSGGHKQASFTIDDNFRNIARVKGDNRKTHAHGLGQHVSKTFP